MQAEMKRPRLPQAMTLADIRAERERRREKIAAWKARHMAQANADNELRAQVSQASVDADATHQDACGETRAAESSAPSRADEDISENRPMRRLINDLKPIYDIARLTKAAKKTRDIVTDLMVLGLLEVGATVKVDFRLDPEIQGDTTTVIVESELDIASLTEAVSAERARRGPFPEEPHPMKLAGRRLHITPNTAEDGRRAYTITVADTPMNGPGWRRVRVGAAQ